MNIFKSRTPRWIIFVIDLCIVLVSIMIAYLLRFNFSIPESEISGMYFAIPFVILVRTISFLILKSYAGIIRYTGAKDAERIFFVVLLGSAFFYLSNQVSFYAITHEYIIPTSVIIIDFLCTVFVMSSSRLFIKALYMELYNPSRQKANTIIYGCEHFATVTKNTIDRDSDIKMKVVAFIDNSLKNIGKRLEGIPIYDLEGLVSLNEKFIVEKLIIAKEHVTAEEKDKIVEKCLNLDIQVLTVPQTDTWINGELSFNQIKSIRIEDLLERDPIVLDKQKIRKELIDQVILVTGAAGSIGSEIVRQLTRFSPKLIVLLDQAETPLYDLELSLNEQVGFKDFEVVIGDVTNTERVEYIFKKYKPDYVYHAAAYKHVPMMEGNPSEAINTNVFGTKTVATLSHKYNVKKFVMVSTDKAVNPTNIMGASKRIGEMFIQALNKNSQSMFITTRFGNVLGSNGSVIPRFKRQIESGGPITITHPEVTRFFMTIPEACQLVLEAGTIGEGGEIFLFDMGKSVKILDLAKKMIKLSGLKIGTDININFTGLRPGEKLYEELLNNKENTLPTHHSQILIAKVRDNNFEKVKADIDELIKLIGKEDNFTLVKLMKKIVPEFKSENSVYEKLDIQTIESDVIRENRI